MIVENSEFNNRQGPNACIFSQLNCTWPTGKRPTLDGLLENRERLESALFARYAITSLRGPQKEKEPVACAICGPHICDHDFDWEAAAIMAAGYGYPADAIRDPQEFLDFRIVTKSRTPDGLVYITQCDAVIDDHPALMLLIKNGRHLVRRLCYLEQTGDRYLVTSYGDLRFPHGFGVDPTTNNVAVKQALLEIRTLTYTVGAEAGAIAALTFFLDEPVLLDFRLALRSLAT